MKRLIIVRHGETEWNAVRRLQGQADIELSEKGRSQATALRGTIARLQPDRAIASDLKRASQTAEVLGFGHAERMAALRENDVGDWTGQPIADIRKTNEDGFLGWRAGTYTPPNGEPWSDFMDRTSRCVMDARKGCDRLLVVCHGGVLRALLEGLIDLPPKRIIPVGPASVTILAERPAGSGNMRLELFNYSPEGPILDAPD